MPPKRKKRKHTQNKRNLIQHVIAKHKTPKPHTTKSPTLTPEEQKLIQTRIRTLRQKEEPKQAITANKTPLNLENQKTTEPHHDQEQEPRKSTMTPTGKE